MSRCFNKKDTSGDEFSIQPRFHLSKGSTKYFAIFKLLIITIKIKDAFQDNFHSTYSLRNSKLQRS